MKRKELEEFKKRWEENLGGLGEMLNSPWFAVSIKYDEAEKNKCCIKLGQYVLRYWAQLHGVDLSPYGDKEITTDEFKQAVTKAQTEMKTDFEGGEGNAENNILDQLKRRLNIILFGTTKPEEDQKIKLGKNDLLSASNVVFFDELWKEAAAEKIAEKNQGNNAEDLVRITFEQMVDFYKKIYPDSTLINTEKGILESIDSASSEMEEAKTSDLGYSVEDAELYEGKFYIYKRMETHYDDTLLGSLQKELDSFNTSKAIEWLAYDVDYLMGEAYPGETAYVLITEDEYTFSKQGAYKLTYVDTGKTTELVDDQGFRWEASVYFVVDEDTYNENLQKMFRAEQALYDTYERILNNFGLAE